MVGCRNGFSKKQDFINYGANVAVLYQKGLKNRIKRVKSCPNLPLFTSKASFSTKNQKRMIAQLKEKCIFA